APVCSDEWLKSGITLTQPGAEQREPGGSAAERAGHRDHVAGHGAAPGDGFSAVEVSERRDGKHDDARAAYIAACDCGARAGALLHDSRYQLEHPADFQFAWSGEADEQSGRPCSHRRNVSEISRRGLAADIARGRPFAAEMPPLDEHVRGGDDLAV